MSLAPSERVLGPPMTPNPRAEPGYSRVRQLAPSTAGGTARTRILCDTEVRANWSQSRRRPRPGRANEGNYSTGSVVGLMDASRESAHPKHDLMSRSNLCRWSPPQTQLSPTLRWGGSSWSNSFLTTSSAPFEIIRRCGAMPQEPDTCLSLIHI